LLFFPVRTVASSDLSDESDLSDQSDSAPLFFKKPAIFRFLSHHKPVSPPGGAVRTGPEHGLDHAGPVLGGRFQDGHVEFIKYVGSTDCSDRGATPPVLPSVGVIIGIIAQAGA